MPCWKRYRNPPVHSPQSTVDNTPQSSPFAMKFPARSRELKPAKRTLGALAALLRIQHLKPNCDLWSLPTSDAKVGDYLASSRVCDIAR
eukprot:6184949-Pleurochrysis_carterae.AAC.1